MKNYIDITRLTLGYVWGTLSILQEFKNLNETDLLALITSLLFWIEGVHAFKIFDSTRYYIWLI